MEHINIAELSPQMVVEQNYILKSHAIKQAKNGSNYLAAELQDKTGTIKGNMWSAAEDLDSMLVDGGFVRAKISTEVYNGTLQCKILSIFEIEPTVDDYQGLVPMAREPIDNLAKELRAVVAEVQSPYREVLENVLCLGFETFKMIPGAKTMHHAEIGGLLMHTVEMLRMEKGILPVIMEKWPVDTDLLYTATILHDWGKIREFKTSEVGLVTDYTVEGNLLGHIQMGVMDVDEMARANGLSDEQCALLEHCILAHHGQPEYGSPVTPMTMEAIILHAVDALSALSEEYADAVSKIDPGTFTQVFGVGKLYRPVGTNSEEK